MKFEIIEAVVILTNTPRVLENLLRFPDEKWLRENEGAGSWSPVQILCHLIHCEEDDWIKRLKIILSDNVNKKFEHFDRTYGFEDREHRSYIELLEEFKHIRENNLKYIGSLDLTDDVLNMKGIHPDFGEVTLKQLLAAWVVHDLGHIAQITRVMAKQYSSETGPWIKYLPILT